MNQDRFDDLTRTLASTTSRRTVLKTLAGSAAGGLLAFLGLGEAAADDTCKPLGKKCNKSSQCCSGGCVNNVCTCIPDNVAACAGRECGTATNNCGQTVSCGTCLDDQPCDDGVCVTTQMAAMTCVCNDLPETPYMYSCHSWDELSTCYTLARGSCSEHCEFWGGVLSSTCTPCP